MPDLQEAALVGKAGEALVAAELLRRHLGVAYPEHDSGVGLLTYGAKRFGAVLPIQVNARKEFPKISRERV